MQSTQMKSTKFSKEELQMANIYEIVLNFTSNQQNANQKSREIPFHPHQNDSH